MWAATTKGQRCVLKKKGTLERVQSSKHNLSACVKSAVLKSSSHPPPRPRSFIICPFLPCQGLTLEIKQKTKNKKPPMSTQTVAGLKPSRDQQIYFCLSVRFSKPFKATVLQIKLPSSHSQPNLRTWWELLALKLEQHRCVTVHMYISMIAFLTCM